MPIAVDVMSGDREPRTSDDHHPALHLLTSSRRRPSSGLRRRGGKVVIINPVRELGTKKFRIPSSVRSLLFGTKIGTLFIQPHIGGDLALLSGLAKAIVEKPTMIIAHTIPGKGVDFMEYDFRWHGKPPDHEQAVKALHELRTLGGKIKGEHE